ncbi:MAG: hypothetical protein M3O61_16425 [Gemmatimonadota bacterium]|nr:hypothetical protein [Gemmatimonadota bacterium]
MKRFRVVALVNIIALSAIPSPAGGQASWVRREYVDAITDDSVRSVSTKTAEGYEFVVYRIARGRVWARFRIPDAIPDVMAHNRPPIYRIDSAPPYDLAADVRISPLLPQPLIQSEPKWVNFVLWHGQEQAIGAGLRALVSGKRLLFRYYPYTGGSKDVSFPLEGFDVALEWLLERKPASGEGPDRPPREIAARIHSARRTACPV